MLMVIVLLAVASCMGDFKMPEMKQAQFNREPELVIQELKEMGDFEDANIKWSSFAIGDSVSHRLKVILINGQNLPAEDSALNHMGRLAMQTVLNSIDNDTAYNQFIVYFSESKKEGGITRMKEQPYSYSLSEFKN